MIELCDVRDCPNIAAKSVPCSWNFINLVLCEEHAQEEWE
jgi:hypothetical protein